METATYKTKNPFATFSLRGGRLCKRGRSVVSYAPFLTGTALAAVLGSMFALSTPSFAQDADEKSYTITTTGAYTSVTTSTTTDSSGSVVTRITGNKVAATDDNPNPGVTYSAPHVSFPNTPTSPTEITSIHTFIYTTGNAITGGRVGVDIYARGDDDVVFESNNNINDVRYGIQFGRYGGKGRLAIVNRGSITNARADGIYTDRSGGGAIEISSQREIDARRRGIDATHNGGGNINIANGAIIGHSTASGVTVTGGDTGIRAKRGSGAAGNIRIVNGAAVSGGTATGSAVTGGKYGIHVRHDGNAGDIEIVNGAVEGATATGSTVTGTSGHGVFVDHNGTEGGVRIVNEGTITGGKDGVRVAHEGSAKDVIRIESRHNSEIRGRDAGIHVRHNDDGAIEIDLSGTVSSVDEDDNVDADGNAIDMESDGTKTLILRSGFSLGGNVVSGGEGKEVLKLERRADDTVGGGTLDLDKFSDFEEFRKVDPGTWTVTGGAADTDDDDAESRVPRNTFAVASITTGNLRFSDATFGVSDSMDIGADTVLEIAGDNKFVGTLFTDGNILFARRGEDDLLEISEVYRGSGGLTFHVGPDGWDDDKLTVKGRVRGSTRREVELDTPGGADVFDGENSPVLIEAHGVSNPNSFVGTKTFGMRSYVLTPNDRTGGGREWRFIKEDSSSSPPVRRIAPTLSRLMLPERTPVPAVPEPGGGSSAGEQSGLGLRGDARGYAGGLWAEQRSSRTSPEYDAATGSLSRLEDNRVRFGFNAPATNLMGGDMVVGASMSQGLSASEVSSPVGDGSIGIESHAAALTALWRSPGGFYADGQARYARFSSSVSAENLFLVRDNEGVGTSVSAELGYGFAVPLGGMDFEVAPQAQLVWSHVDFDDFIGLHGGLFSLEDGDLVTGRLGLSWDGEWQDAGGSGRIYGGMNLHDSVDGRTSVNVSGESFVSKQGLSVDGKLGLSYEWDGGYAVYGEATAVRRDGAEEVRANLGMSIDF